jgi:hypothetical protein
MPSRGLGWHIRRATGLDPEMQPPEKEPLVYHGGLDPISAAFALRYVHILVRMWVVSELLAVSRLQK